MRKFTAVAFFFLLLGSPAIHAADRCKYDEEALLALDENAFDQDLSGGWRAIASIPGCELAAAELLGAQLMGGVGDMTHHMLPRRVS